MDPFFVAVFLLRCKYYANVLKIQRPSVINFLRRLPQNHVTSNPDSSIRMKLTLAQLCLSHGNVYQACDVLKSMGAISNKPGVVSSNPHSFNLHSFNSYNFNPCSSNSHSFNLQSHSFSPHSFNLQSSISQLQSPQLQSSIPQLQSHTFSLYLTTTSSSPISCRGGGRISAAL